jgi:chromosome segregation ATPase
MHLTIERQLKETQENAKAQMATFTLLQEKYLQEEKSLKQQLKEQVEKYQAIIKEFQQTLQKEKEIYQSQLTDAEYKNHELESSLHQKQKEYDKLDHKLEKSQEKFKDLETEWGILKKEHENLTPIFQQKNILLAQKDIKLHHLHLQLTEAKHKINKLDEDIKENHWKT